VVPPSKQTAEVSMIRIWPGVVWEYLMATFWVSPALYVAISFLVLAFSEKRSFSLLFCFSRYSYLNRLSLFD